MKVVLLYILIIFLIFTNSLKSNELKKYNIVFIDVIDDPRYKKWGIHPVDIRSKLTKEKRAIEGAKLAIEESKKIERLTKTKFTLKHIRLKNFEEALNYLKTEKIKNYNTVLLDLHIKNFEALNEIIKKNNVSIFFNVSDPNNKLRKQICLANFFHTIPSNQMLTDSVSQYLIKKKWNKSLLLTGPLDKDMDYSNSFRTSAKKFGIKIINEKFFVNNNDPRVRDKNDLSFLTKGKKYNNVFVSDIDGEFSLSVPNATMNNALVTGSAGLIPKAWHWSYLRHGAPQLNGRFERLNNRRMNSEDWAAWISIKTIIESILRTQKVINSNIIKYIKSSSFQLDGSKGISLNYKDKINQLRQTILLVSSNNWVTAKIPLEDFQNRKNNLDTIGISVNDTNCEKGD